MNSSSQTVWDGDEYKGINSRWRDRVATGQAFEVQFHTPESWDAKQKTHDTYEKISRSWNTALSEASAL